MWRRLLSNVLQLAVALPLLLASCAPSGLLYVQSAQWTLRPVAGEPPASFFVAYRPAGAQAAVVAPFRALADEPAARRDFRLPEGQHRIGSARVEVAGTDGGDLRVTVRFSGAMWISVSEYRVAGNVVGPLRHGHSAAWVLLVVGAMGLALFAFVNKRLSRLIDRKIGVV